MTGIAAQKALVGFWKEFNTQQKWRRLVARGDIEEAIRNIMANLEIY